MTSPMFTRPSVKGVPVPFRPQDYVDCAALVMEPVAKQIVRHNGRDRLEMVARLTVFDAVKDIEADDPAEEVEMVVTWGRIASLLSRAFIDGNPVAGRIGQDAPTSYGTRPWKLDDLDDEVETCLVGWLKARGSRK